MNWFDKILDAGGKYLDYDNAKDQAELDAMARQLEINNTAMQAQQNAAIQGDKNWLNMLMIGGGIVVFFVIIMIVLKRKV